MKKHKMAHLMNVMAETIPTAAALRLNGQFWGFSGSSGPSQETTLGFSVASADLTAASTDKPRSTSLSLSIGSSLCAVGVAVAVGVASSCSLFSEPDMVLSRMLVHNRYSISVSK